jgi:hypothetical protein
MRKSFLLLGITCTLLLGSGCGGGPSLPTFYPVKGTVLLDGKPVCFANVSLTPKDSTDEDTPAATGQTNANGEFSIRSMIGPGYDGAMPGEYWVSLSAPKQAPADANGSKPTAIPQKYRNPKTAKISVSVGQQSNDLGTIRLQSQS